MLMLRLPDPGTYEHLLTPIYIKTISLLRLSRYPKTELWWSQNRSRFDGPVGVFGTTYAAQELEVAFCESIIHESAWFEGGQYNIPHADLHSRHIVRLKRQAKPMLKLADVTGNALKKLGLNNDISAGDDYTVPQAWARAIYDQATDWDGIWYVSRQSNGGRAAAIFDRSGAQKSSSRKLDGRKLDELCDLYGVVAV
ncbi:MAG: RES family NAD+ phosphorylase [Aquincola tertiaricarbonis]